MTYQVLLSPKAFSEAVQHVEFLSRVSIDAAKELALDIAQLPFTLKDMPYSHPIIAFPGRGVYRRLILRNRYAVIFIVEDDRVLVDAIVDTRSFSSNLFCIEPTLQGGFFRPSASLMW